MPMRRIRPLKRRQLAYRVNLILQAIAANDVHQLRLLARSENGLVYDWLRRQAWPILLHTLDGVYLREKGSANLQGRRTLPLLLSTRSASSLIPPFPPSPFPSPPKLWPIPYPHPFRSADITPLLKTHRQRELHDMLVEILWRNPRLHYYQGFHDVCTCFLLVLGKRGAIPAAENVAPSRYFYP
ncbi:hypothetical protein BC937DRAFT_89821 [Endogone sp. FLAS-F59071]|nr:hypothetical protein BC937DRAFT_89821 [Endogone sp. FLAS-F59071]|eukprot:RUS17553.1 hypothetical protein BC937DRAFT_89821 [Endogone sp. FLAS-F59071]